MMTQQVCVIGQPRPGRGWRRGRVCSVLASQSASCGAVRKKGSEFIKRAQRSAWSCWSCWCAARPCSPDAAKKLISKAMDWLYAGVTALELPLAESEVKRPGRNRYVSEIKRNQTCVTYTVRVCMLHWTCDSAAMLVPNKLANQLCCQFHRGSWLRRLGRYRVLEVSLI